MNNRYYELGEDVVVKFTEMVEKFAYNPIRIDYAFIGDNKLKDTVFKITKINDVNEFLTKKQLLITINQNIYDRISEQEEVIEILVREELSKIKINGETGKIKIEKYNFNSSKTIIEKYSYEEVSKAKELVKLISEQVADKNSDEIDLSE